MITIREVSTEIKSNIYENLVYTIHLLNNNIEFEKLDKYDPTIIKKYFENINAFDKFLYPDEKLKVMVEQTIKGLNNVFSVDVAKDRIKSDIIEITAKLISKLKSDVNFMEVNFTNFGVKSKQITKMIDSSKSDVTMLIDANKYFNTTFELKTELLKSNQEFLAKSYRGDLFLNHSVQTLLTICKAITDSLFKSEELCKGRDISKSLDIPGVANVIKYYIPKTEVTKVETENLMKYDRSEFVKKFEELPKLVNSDIDGIIDFIKSLHSPDPQAQPDSPASAATLFDEFTKSVMMAWSRASGYFDTNIRLLINDTSAIRLTPLVDICSNIDSSYKDICNAEETGNDVTKPTEILKCYLKLLEIGSTSSYYDLECRAYDLVRYLSHLDYFLFMKNLACVMYLEFRDKTKDKEVKPDEGQQPQEPQQTQQEQAAQEQQQDNNQGGEANQQQ